MNTKWNIVIDIVVLLIGVATGAFLFAPEPETEYIVLTRENFMDVDLYCQRIYLDAELAGTNCYEKEADRPLLWASLPVSENY